MDLTLVGLPKIGALENKRLQKTSAKLGLVA
jgi:hypothetical protein